LLRELPVVGILFGRRAREQDSEELVVLVTPYLLH
jgi:type II secretory pathway component HofQ